ncbi:hypothetical protein C1645_816299 [Glomus cerebriforme]|uniref:Uncharacterized protein n=1 Tax=Glomus cerebriforme TaxID=658196 RepID=A0A397TLJ3_9GLOM|nr:hypothetical protein C1645_816299 [Glomus cerebriforme]
MSTIRKELINAAISRATTLGDYNVPNDIDKQFEFIQQTEQKEFVKIAIKNV